MSHEKNGGKGRRPGKSGSKPPFGGKPQSGSKPQFGTKPKPGNKPAPGKKQKAPLNLDFSQVPKRNSGRRDEVAPAARPNQRLGEFVIDRLSHDGRGVAQWQGKTLFVADALAGERITARFVSEHGRYAEAVVDEVLEAAAERVAPPCPHYRLCGGCQLQHMPETQQILLKQDALLEQMQRWGGLRPRRILPPIQSAVSGYRSRARLGVWYEPDGSVTLGFRQRQSKQLTAVEACLVLVPTLNNLLAPLQAWLGGLEATAAVTHIELIDSAKTAAVIVRHVKPLTARDRELLKHVAEAQHCQIWLQGDKGASLSTIDGVSCDPRLDYDLPDFSLRMAFHPQDFIQVNPTVNRLMVNQALNLLNLTGTERVLDLFCGIGNFTLPLAQRSAEVIGIEAVEAMVARGRENAGHNGLQNTTFMAADLSKLSINQLNQRCGRIDAVLLDPPRDGAREVVANVGQLAAKSIVYVSCNPATLARDAKILAASGYQLDSLGVLDMFPHTAHVESMALFVRP